MSHMFLFLGLLLLLIIIEQRREYFRESLRVIKNNSQEFYADILPIFFRARESVKRYYRPDHILMYKNTIHIITEAYKSEPFRKEYGFWTLKTTEIGTVRELKKLYMDNNEGCYCCLYKSWLFLLVDNIEAEKKLRGEIEDLKANIILADEILNENFFVFLENLFYGKLINTNEIKSYEKIISANQEIFDEKILGKILNAIIKYLPHYISQYNDFDLSQVLDQLNMYQDYGIPEESMLEIKRLLNKNSEEMQELLKQISIQNEKSKKNVVLSRISMVSDFCTLLQAAREINEKIPGIMGTIFSIAQDMLKYL